MSRILKWKKTLPIAVAAGIMCLSAYGIYHTAYAYSDIKQSQTPDNTPAVLSAPAGDGLVPGGTVCNPLGCAACGGCTNSVYLENIASIQDSAIQMGQID